MFSEVSTLLTRNYIKAGLTTEEYVVLNAYLNHSKLLENSYDFQEVGEMIGKTKTEVTRILTILFDKKFIQVKADSSIDIKSLKQKLKSIELESLSISDQIAESMAYYDIAAQYDSKCYHKGHVTLIPYENDMVAVAKGVSTIHGNCMWNRDSMKKLANEILKFVETTDQDWIDEYNENLKEEMRIEKEKQRIVYEENKEKKEQAAKPRHGYVILIRLYPSGHYKFTYTVSNDLNGKINRLKEEYGNNVEIVHSAETYDTMKFYYQFAKKQFSNRLIEKTMYQLTEEDVQFFKEEKYPANAMDWLEGSRIK